MRNILENSRDLPLPTLLPKQKILYRFQSLINKMIPATRITIQQRWSLDILFPIRLAALTLKSIMGITRRLTMILEQFPQTIEREMTLYILGGVYHAGGEGLLVRLALESFC